MVYYEPIPASDGTSLTAPSNAEFRVFEVSDTARATPVELRTAAGTNAAPLVTTAQGVLPGVEVVSPNFSHIFKSGEWEWRRDSVEGIRKAAEGARTEAAISARAAMEAAGTAQAPTDQAVDEGIVRANLPAKVASAVAAQPTVAAAAAAAVDANPKIAELEAAKWTKAAISGPGPGRDANDFKTPGFVGILYGAIPNLPEPSIGAMEVLPFGTGVIQRYTVWDKQQRVYLRRLASGAWGGWDLQPTSAQVAEMENTIATLEASVPSTSLADWNATYATANTTPVRVLAIGDSITEGSGASTLANRWQTLLQEYLNRHKGLPRGAIFPFIPGRYATSAPGRPTTDTGTIVGGYGWGLGWRTVTLRDDTSKITYTFRGTSAEVMFTKTPTAAIMRITVDGGTPVLVSTNGTTDNAAKWYTGALPAGEHTITIERDPSSPAGQYVWLQGILTYNGDETKGVRVIDSAKHGVGAGGQLSAANNTLLATAAKASGPFALTLIGLGTNDVGVGTTPAAYKASIEALITTLRSGAEFTGSIVLINMFRGGGRTDAQWTPYGDMLATIAAADPKVTYLDLRWHMPDVPSPVNDAAGQGMYVDALHPSDVGHRKIAGVLADLLT